MIWQGLRTLRQCNEPRSRISREINRLDPREFVPAGQYRFVKLQMRVAHLAGLTTYTNQDLPHQRRHVEPHKDD